MRKWLKETFDKTFNDNLSTINAPPRSFLNKRLFFEISFHSAQVQAVFQDPFSL